MPLGNTAHDSLGESLGVVVVALFHEGCCVYALQTPGFQFLTPVRPKSHIAAVQPCNFVNSNTETPEERRA